MPPALRPSLTLGAIPAARATSFRVHAPEAGVVELAIESGAKDGTLVPLARAANGDFVATVRGVRAGDRYRYRLDGRGPFPDPASRFQPLGVHGPSEVVDPRAYRWRDRGWRGRGLESLVLYELHVGAFTPRGTFDAVRAKLGHLRRLGVNAIELMPVHAFPGSRNWGYDPGALFAPAASYGRPDDLRRLVDAAHARGIAVLLDVVYNHLGPDGAYVVAFHPGLFPPKRKTPWGRSMNLDGAGSAAVREFLIENALHWLIEYRFDGLRLDATWALEDRSRTHLLAELTARARAAIRDREVVLIAEDGRNLNRVLRPAARGGFGLDAEWTFDFHHTAHRVLTGESVRRDAPFRGTLAALATSVKQGWIDTGRRRGGHRGRGTSPRGIPPERFVFFLQSHDEVGNRPLGDRLSSLVPPPVSRAATALLLLSPQTPMLFMGEEWAAATPFHFFTDHKPGLGERIAAARNRFFARWPGFRSAAAHARIADPQAIETFAASRLDWSEPRREPHAGVLRLHRALLALRRRAPALRAGGRHEVSVADGALVLVRSAPGAPPLALVVRLGGGGRVALGAALGAGTRWAPRLSTEDPAFAADPRPIRLARTRRGPAVTFRRPGALLLERERLPPRSIAAVSPARGGAALPATRSPRARRPGAPSRPLPCSRTRAGTPACSTRAR